MVRLGMSKHIKDLYAVQDEQNESKPAPTRVLPESNASFLKELLTRVVSHKPSTRHGGRPVTSIAGNPPTRRLGKINGPCSQCDSRAKTRFETIPYCGKHYRYNLRIREDEVMFEEISQDSDFSLESWSQYLRARDSEFNLYGVTKLIKYGYSAFLERNSK